MRKNSDSAKHCFIVWILKIVWIFRLNNHFPKKSNAKHTQSLSPWKNEPRGLIAFRSTLCACLVIAFMLSFHSGIQRCPQIWASKYSAQYYTRIAKPGIHSNVCIRAGSTNRTTFAVDIMFNLLSNTNDNSPTLIQSSVSIIFSVWNCHDEWPATYMQ